MRRCHFLLAVLLLCSPANASDEEKKVEQAPAGKHECRRYDAIANMTISVPCPD